MAKRAKKEAPKFFTAPLHPVSRVEWDNTMRAAMTGLIASGETIGDGSYTAVVVRARIYAEFAHGGRPYQ